MKASKAIEASKAVGAIKAIEAIGAIGVAQPPLVVVFVPKVDIT